MAHCISYHICSESRHDAAGGIARTVGAGICRARRCGPLDPSRPPAAPAIAHLIWAECARECACCCGCAVRGSRRCVREQARSMCARVALALVIPQKYVAACMLQLVCCMLQLACCTLFYVACRMSHVVCCTACGWVWRTLYSNLGFPDRSSSAQMPFGSLRNLPCTYVHQRARTDLCRTMQCCVASSCTVQHQFDSAACSKPRVCGTQPSMRVHRLLRLSERPVVPSGT